MAFFVTNHVISAKNGGIPGGEVESRSENGYA
jgi:hypothetical protein